MQFRRYLHRHMGQILIGISIVFIPAVTKAQAVVQKLREMSQKEAAKSGITPEARGIVRILPFTTRLNFTNPGVGDRYK